MKTNLLALLLMGFLFACSSPKQPEFQSIANPKVIQLSMKKTHIEVDVVLNNPNGVGVDITKMEVDIFVNNVHIGKTTQTHEAIIPADSNFNLPLKFEFSPKEVLNIGSLGGLLGALKDKKVKMKYKGFVSVKVLDKELSVPFDYDDEMVLKK